LGIYLRLIDSTLQTAERRAYRSAAKQLKRAQRSAAAAGLSEEFDEHLTGLREQHRRRPVGARYSVVGADQARWAAILKRRASHLVPLLRDAGSPGRRLRPFERCLHVSSNRPDATASSTSTET